MGGACPPKCSKYSVCGFCIPACKEAHGVANGELHPEAERDEERAEAGESTPAGKGVEGGGGSWRGSCFREMGREGGGTRGWGEAMEVGLGSIQVASARWGWRSHSKAGEQRGGKARLCPQATPVAWHIGILCPCQIGSIKAPWASRER